MHRRTYIPVLALIAAAIALPHISRAADTCTFTTDLTIGTESASVKCLQQYLNANGFTIASTGVGSSGHETTQFKEKTQAAVKAWQTANGITPATGTFGAKSRAKYKELTSGTPTPLPTPTPEPTPAPVPTPAPTTDSPLRSQARNSIKSAHNDYDDAVSDYEDAHDNGDDTGGAKSLLADAEEKLIEALYAYVDEDYSAAIDAAKKAQTDINDAVDEVKGSHGSGSKDEAKKAIKDTKSDLDDAWDDVDNAKGSTKKAENFLKKAQEKIKDAEDSYDEKNYDDVLDSIDDAQGYISDAEDAL